MRPLLVFMLLAWPPSAIWYALAGFPPIAGQPGTIWIVVVGSICWATLVGGMWIAYRYEPPSSKTNERGST